MATGKYYPSDLPWHADDTGSQDVLAINDSREDCVALLYQPDFTGQVLMAPRMASFICRVALDERIPAEIRREAMLIHELATVRGEV